MPAESLQEVYREKLQDLYDAENQIIAALPKMANATSSSELQEAFQHHLEQTKGQVKRLEQVFKQLGEHAEGKKCLGMEGLLKEGEELLDDQGKGSALDAALIAAAQSVEHYEIAAYGSAQTWARQLGQDQAADLLEETLEEEKQTDADLSEIAETLVNPEAGGDSEEEEEDEEEEEETDEEEEEEALERSEREGGDREEM